jgi:hypothetical protein
MNRETHDALFQGSVSEELHLATAQRKEPLLTGSVELGVLGRESHGKRVLQI